MLSSVLNFELLASLIELDQSAQVDLRPEVSCDFAAFLSDPQRPLAARLAAEDSMRTALLPGSSDAQVALDLLNLDRLAHQQAAAIGERWDGIVDSLTAKRLHAAAGG